MVVRDSETWPYSIADYSLNRALVWSAVTESPLSLTAERCRNRSAGQQLYLRHRSAAFQSGDSVTALQTRGAMTIRARRDTIAA